MQTRINAETAEQIVRTVSDISGRDINFISPDGMIIASTDKKRVGTYHEIGHRAAAEGKDLKAEETDTFRGTKAGVNLPFLWKGETARSGFYADYLQKNGFDEHSMLRMVAARISTRYNPANLTLAEEEIYRVFRSGGSPLYTFLYPDQYVLILKERSYRDMRGVLEKLAWDMKNFLAVGVGSAEMLPDISRSYRSAMLAASAASPGILAEYDRLHTELLLGTLSEEAMELYVRRVLSNLTEKDIQYLEVYFRSNCSLKEAAAELYIHKNTLQYRLDRVRDLSGYDPRFFADAADLMLALKCRMLLQGKH